MYALRHNCLEIVSNRNKLYQRQMIESVCEQVNKAYDALPQGDELAFTGLLSALYHAEPEVRERAATCFHEALYFKTLRHEQISRANTCLIAAYRAESAEDVKDWLGKAADLAEAQLDELEECEAELWTSI